MQIERYGTRLSTHSLKARGHVEDAILRILAHRPDVDAALSDALNRDPACVAAHALRGLCQVTLARADSLWRARGHLSRAQAAMRQGRSSMDEQALVQVLGLAVHGSFRAAADRLETEVAERPTLVLFAKLAQALRFMVGDVDALARAIDHSVDHLEEGARGYGFLLGCKAFACEETGAFERAEEFGRRAVAIEPADAWGMHAVSHVYEMTGRPVQGLAWIDASRGVWQSCNNFALHMSWHAALFHIEQGDHATALALFDGEIWPRASSDFRDMANAVSLLARLEFFGIDVGPRWASLGEVAGGQRRDGTYVFASLHNLIALLAAGRAAEAAELLETFERPTLPGNDQGRVLRSIGRPLARLIFNAASGRGGAFEVGATVEALRLLGGSGAQRDLFVRLLADLAVKQGDAQALDEVLALRRQLKHRDLFEREIRNRLQARNSIQRHIA